MMKTAILTAAAIAAADEYRSGSYGYAVRHMHNGTPAVYHHASTFEEGFLRRFDTGVGRLPVQHFAGHDQRRRSSPALH